MMDRPLSPITERSSFSSRRSDIPSLTTHNSHPTPIREISYESEHEADDDGASIYSQVSSGETVTAARTTTGAFAYIEDSAYPSAPERMAVARPITSPYPTTPLRTPRSSTPTSPTFGDIPLPGGLLPPPRGKRDSGQSFSSGFSTPPHPAMVPVQIDSRRRRPSYADAYPGGREVINLNDETDDEGDYDARSVATATTAGLAGLGAGERAAMPAFGMVEVEKVQGALKGIMEEQDMQMRRFRESAPTPPRSRPNSFFYDPNHPTLHNIPTFSPPAEKQDSPIRPTFRSRTSSRLIKSPPISRPVSRPESIKGGKSADRQAEGEESAPTLDHHGSIATDREGAVYKQEDRPVVPRDLSMQDALDPNPPPIPSPLAHPDVPHSSPSILRSKTPPSSKKRTSRIIPHVLFSLFADTSVERKREAGAVGDQHTDSKLNGDAQAGRIRTKSKLAKPRSARRMGSTGSKSDIPMSDGLRLREGLRPEALEATVRLSGTFGVMDDGSDVDALPGSPDLDSPRGLGLGLRRWSSSTPAGILPSRPSPDRSPERRARAGSFRTDITSGTAQTFAPDRDRELFTPGAVGSTDDLVPISHGRANADDLPPISERSDMGHTSSDGHSAATVGHQGDGQEWRDSPRTPEEVRMPETGKVSDPGVSAVTPPHPLPRVYGAELADDIEGEEVGYAYPGKVWLEEVVMPSNQSGVSEKEVHSLLVPPPRRRLPSTPAPSPPRHSPHPDIPTTTPTPAEGRVSPRARTSSNAPPPLSSPPGLPPLPASLQGLALTHTSPADLPLLIASHLLSSHATSLLRHSSQAKDMGEEMYRLAQESLEWGRVLMSMAGGGSQPGMRADEEGVGEKGKGRDGDGTIRPRDVSPRRRYDGMPGQSEREDVEDAYTRLPIRRQHSAHRLAALEQHHPPNPSKLAPSPTPPPVPALSTRPTKPLTPLHQDIDHSSIARAKRADRQRKSESLPPEWFQRVEHLSASGWDKIHEAEQVWREGMEEEAASLLRAGSVGTYRTQGVDGEAGAVEGGTSEEYIALVPLSANGDGLGGGVGDEKTAKERVQASQGGQGSRKLVKRPSKRALAPDSRVVKGDEGGLGGAGGGDTVKAKVAPGTGAEGAKSRWWKRK